MLDLLKNNKNKKNKKEYQMVDFFTSCGTHVNGSIMVMLYTHSIGN